MREGGNFDMAESLAQLFDQHFHAHRLDSAVRQRRGYRTESFTYAQILDLAHAFARSLAARSIVKGDRIMIWGEKSAQWISSFFGSVLRGVIVVPMDNGSSLDFVHRVFQQVQAKLLVTSRVHEHDCATAGISLPSVILEDLAQSPQTGPQPPPVTLAPDDTLQIVFTSGTTADPRGVVITHGNVLANIAPVEREMQPYLKYERLVHPIRFLNLLPLSHVFGQFLGMFLPPLLGGTVIFQEELRPSEIIDTIRRERVSVLVSVPRVLQSLKQKIERDLEDHHRTAAFRRRFRQSENKHFLHRWWIFRSIRRQFGWKFWAFISGGAALDRDTEEFWHRLGYAAIQGYGLTETTSLISVNHPFRLGRGSIGKVLPGRELKLADDGEILVRGGGVASAYWDQRGQHAVADGQGWYRTGDLGALDEAGNLYFKGRKKEVIVTPGGTKIYPDDLEAALRRQPEVKDCAVVGIDRAGNAEPCAVLILRDSASPDQVVARANQSLAEYQRMHLWLQWPDQDFPRTNTQKPRRNVIREAAEANVGARKMGVPHPSRALGERLGISSGQSLSANLQDVGPTTADLIARISGRQSSNLTANTALDSDLGLTSLDRVELLSTLEDRYQVDLSETRFNTVKTVGDLDRMLRGDSAPTPGYHYPAWTLRWPITWFRLAAHYLLMRPAVLLLGWPRIEGRHHLVGVKGPLLVISNHVGDIDPGFVLTALPARFRHRLAIATGGEALEALRTPAPSRNFFLKLYDRLQWLLGVSLLNLFPLPREAGFRRSFAFAGQAVDRGYNILVFPEGRHTTNGSLLPFRTGIGLLAQNLAIPVLPMRIDGLFEPKQAGKHLVAPNTIQVRIGTPIRFDPTTPPDEIAQVLHQAVLDL